MTRRPRGPGGPPAGSRGCPEHEARDHPVSANGVEGPNRHVAIEAPATCPSVKGRTLFPERTAGFQNRRAFVNSHECTFFNPHVGANQGKLGKLFINRTACRSGSFNRKCL